MTPSASSTSAPGFFGRVPLLLSEQKRFAAVQGSLRELRDALEVGIVPPPARLEPSELVEELAQVLLVHFEAAEQGLERIASRRPDLLPSVVDMRTDHTSLSRAVADLRLLATDRARWPELPGRLAAVLGALGTHRETEAALLCAAEQAPAASLERASSLLGRGALP